MKHLLITTALIFLSSLATAQTPFHQSPGASEILMSLSKEALKLRASLHTIADTPTDPNYAALVAGTIKFDVTSDVSVKPRVIKITLSASGAHSVDTSSGGTNEIGKLVPKIAAQVYPWPTAASATDKTVGDWMKDPAVKELVGNADIPVSTDGSGCVTTAITAYTGDVVSSLFNYCNAEMASTHTNFWFEVMPVHMHCQMVSSANLYNARAVLREATLCPSNNFALSQSQWETYRAELMAEILTGAIIWEAEKAIDQDSTNFMKNKVRCFPATGAFNEKVIASMAIPFKTDPASTKMHMGDTGVMSMPEPNYALGAAAGYYSDEKTAVFNNTFQLPPTAAAASTAPDQFPRIELTKTTYIAFRYTEGGSLYFNFNIRGLAQPNSPATCPAFCKNDSPVPLRARAPASLPSVFDYYFRVPPLRKQES